MAKYLIDRNALRDLVKESLQLTEVINIYGVELDKFYIDEYAIDKLIKEITK